MRGKRIANKTMKIPYKVEIKKQWNANIIPTPPEYVIKFTIGHQTFTIDPYTTGTKEEAEWMKDQLDTALGRLSKG